MHETTQPETPEQDQATPREEIVQSLATGLRVLESFSDARPRMTLSEVARQTGISRASARRMLRTLVAQGYAHTDGRDFELTPKVLGLGYGFWSRYGLKELLQLSLQDLASHLHESCSAAVLAGEDIVYIARVHTRRIMQIDLGVGTTLPAYATSMGRVLLSQRSDEELRDFFASAERPALTANTITGVEALVEAVRTTRERGYALVDQELEAGLRSVAVPVAHPRRGVLAAMNISVSAGLESAEESLERVLEPLQHAALHAQDVILAWEKGTSGSAS